MLRRLVIAIVLSLWVAGCSASTFKTYLLPVSANAAHFTFAAIAEVASSRGLEVARFDESIHVRLDDSSWAYFTVQLEEYNLVIHLDNASVPESERIQRLEAAHQQADQIWKQAMGSGY